MRPSLTGRYMYIEASYPRQANDNAKLSFSSAGSGTFCLSFYYHMYGGGIGTLKVLNGGQIKFSKSGDQGNAWTKAEVDVTGNGNVRINMWLFRVPKGFRAQGLGIKNVGIQDSRPQKKKNLGSKAP